jgi:RNA polymerase sigma-70 factor, ECF subfamily
VHEPPAVPRPRPPCLRVAETPPPYGLDPAALGPDLRRRMQRLALRVLHDRHEAEDAVQDALLRAWRGAHQLRDPAALEAWVLSVTRNAALDRLRALAVARRTRPLDDDAGAAAPAHHGTADLEAAVARLSPALRRAVRLHAEGHTLGEAARLEGTSYTAAKTRLCRARAQLRAALGA